jgi:GntR family transcriptional regulator / MocR family aminotransferase
LHIQLTVKAGRSAVELLEMAASEGVRIYDFRQMWMEPEREEGEPKVYLGFGGINVQDIEQGVALLAKAWEGVWTV